MVDHHQKRAIGVFHNRQEAESALNDLKATGFSMNNVSIIAKQTDSEEQVGGVEISDQVGDKSVENPTGLPADGVTTATWSTLLVGLTSLAIPGAGPVLAAGALGVSLITGIAGVGMGVAASNSLIKALEGLGIPEKQARVYSDRLIQGNYLVLLEGNDDEIERANEIFSDQGIRGWGVYPVPQT